MISPHTSYMLQISTTIISVFGIGGGLGVVGGGALSQWLYNRK